MSRAFPCATAWVHTAPAVAILPLRLQYLPGFVPPLVAFTSMFRRPPRRLWQKCRRRATGFATEEPK